MTKSRFTKPRSVFVLRQGEEGASVEEVCRKQIDIEMRYAANRLAQFATRPYLQNIPVDWV